MTKQSWLAEKVERKVAGSIPLEDVFAFSHLNLATMIALSACASSKHVACNDYSGCGRVTHDY